LDIISNVYGYNGHLPDIVINEFTTQGSKSRPDIVELYVKSSGNIGGLTLYEGSMSDWESRKILPAVEVTADSYILIHFRPQGIEAEIDETTSTSSSGGISAHDQAWDFWVEEGNGLSGNNGALVLASSPQGVILDAVIYSNRTSSSDDKHRGFGNARNLLRAEEIHAAMAWESAEGDIRPEDAINPENSTATRSMCRGSDSEDTNRKEDWHIVPTSTASFGEKNSDEEHEP